MVNPINDRIFNIRILSQTFFNKVLREGEGGILVGEKGGTRGGADTGICCADVRVRNDSVRRRGKRFRKGYLRTVGFPWFILKDNRKLKKFVYD